MPVEVAEKIMSNMSIIDMGAYDVTSKANKRIMHDAIMLRFETILKEFGMPIRALMDAMHVQRAVISGSMALYMLQPWGGHWQPNDMDMYVPRWRARKLVWHLRSMGFVPIRECKVADEYRPINAIASITKLTNGHRSIDVVESSSTSPLDPIFKFHLTAVMNYMSSDGFFCAYPNLTNMCRSLKSRISYENDEPCANTLLGHEKYEGRGFELAFNTKKWEEMEGKTHRCRLSWYCPHSIRTTYDAGCFFMPFRIFPEEKTKEGSAPRCFKERRAIVWHLGGERCEDSYEPLRPFSTTLGAYALL